MFKSRRTEMTGLIQQEREMSKYLFNMLDNDMDQELASILFLEQYPGEEDTLDDLIKDYYG